MQSGLEATVKYGEVIIDDQVSYGITEVLACGECGTPIKSENNPFFRCECCKKWVIWAEWVKPNLSR